MKHAITPLLLALAVAIFAQAQKNAQARGTDRTPNCRSGAGLKIQAVEAVLDCEEKSEALVEVNERET